MNILQGPGRIYTPSATHLGTQFALLTVASTSFTRIGSRINARRGEGELYHFSTKIDSTQSSCVWEDVRPRSGITSERTLGYKDSQATRTRAHI
jgi:hypothetical protein